MPTVNLPEPDFSWNMIIYFRAFIVAVCGIIAAIVKGWEAWKKISVRDRVKKLEERVDKIDIRLEQGNKRFDAQSDDMGQMLITQQALLMHMISGNDHDHLKTINEDLVKYMAKRKMREEN